MTFLYFAYGSNMLSARLKARCPSAKVIGKATGIVKVAPRLSLLYLPTGLTTTMCC